MWFLIIFFFIVDPCKDIDYAILDDPERNSNHDSDVDGYASPQCDKDYVEGDWKGGDLWYRFQEPAGTQMADSAVGAFSCGSMASGWLNGTHPTILGESVIRQVCFSWHESDCQFSTDVEIKNCGGYHLYKLKATPAGSVSPLPSCSLKYCGQCNTDRGGVKPEGRWGACYWNLCVTVLDRRPKFYGRSRRFKTYGYGYGGRSLRPFLRPKVLFVVFLVFFPKWRLKCKLLSTFYLVTRQTNADCQ